MKHHHAKYAVIFQLLAVLLLQWYPVGRSIGQLAAGGECHGDHVECGCLAERIVSRTCCCFQKVPLCHGGHHEEEGFAAGEGADGLTVVAAAPCGGTPEYLADSPETLAYLLPVAPSLEPERHWQTFPSSLPRTAATRSTEPPEPPPKISLFS